MKKAENTPHSWSEERLQMECFKYFSNTFPQFRKLLFHVPSGGLRDKREAAKFQRLGVVSGISDLICLIGGCTFIELKRADGKGQQDPEQKKFEQAVDRMDFPYFLINDLEEFKKLINMIIKDYERGF